MVWPTCAVPEIVGRTVFRGADESEMIGLGCEFAVSLPSALDAVTSTRTVLPTSAEVSLYDFDVAPAMSAHAAPLLEQRCHWYAYAVGLFAHEPFPAVTVSPTWNLPSIVGGDVVFGGSAFAGRANTAARIVRTRTARFMPNPSLRRVF